MRERDNTGGGVVTTGLPVYARTRAPRGSERKGELRDSNALNRERTLRRCTLRRCPERIAYVHLRVRYMRKTVRTHTYVGPSTILRLGARNLLQPHCSVMFEFRRLRRRDARVAFNLRCVTFIAHTCVYVRALMAALHYAARDGYERKNERREKEVCLCALYIYTVARKYGEARDDSWEKPFRSPCTFLANIIEQVQQFSHVTWD